jgi:hypothetical protein
MGKSAGGGVSIFLCKLDNQITNLYLSVPAIINKLEELIEIKSQIRNFKMHLVKDDPVVKIDNFDEFNRQSMELFGVDVKVYDNGGHELESDFLRFL